MVTLSSDQEMKDHAPNSGTKEPVDSDVKSNASFDPLFDDEPEDQQGTSNSGVPNPQQQQQPKITLGVIPPPKNAPPLLDSAIYSAYSPDILMTASIDGQLMIWDRRVDIPGSGVGRLWMSEKTPPWCLSVYSLSNI